MLHIKSSRVATICLIGLSLVYFASRLLFLTRLPIFTDEAIYIRWGQIAAQDANWRFISLTDGKGPFFIWLMMPFFKFVSDPLFAGRIVSVFAGFGTMLGLFFLSTETFKNKTLGVIASLLYVIFPFALVYDKMALYDSLVGTFAVWGLYLVILLVRYTRLDIALLLGMAAGASVLNKSNGFFTLLLLPFSLVLFDFTKKDWKNRLVKLVFFAGIAIVLTFMIYFILRLSPFFHIIDEKNTTFIYPFKEWIKSPLAYIIGNLKGLTDWFVTYMTVPAIVLVIASFFVSKKFLREKLLLLAWFAGPFFVDALFGKVIYPRYIFPMTLSLLPLVALSVYELLQRIKNKTLLFGILFLCFAFQLWADYFIITDFAAAPIPKADVSQYSTDWPAGGGVKEAVTFFQQQGKDQKIHVVTQGTFGLMPYALEMYLKDNQNIKIQGLWPINDMPPKEIMDTAKVMPTYVLFYQPCPPCASTGVAPISWPLKEEISIKKSNGNFLKVYRVLPQ